MSNNFKELYKVKRTPVEISNEIQFGLRENEEYEKITDKQCEEILNFFAECYPQVLIEIPKKRKKTPKSINEKSKNKEIERLANLYVIEGISKEEIEELYSLLEQRIDENKQLDSIIILEDINTLLKSNIQDLNIEKFLEEIMIEQISNSTKKALLRILTSKIEKSDIKQKQEILNMLDEKYGKKAEIITGIPENNIIEYEEIEKIRKNPYKLEALHKEVDYLKSTDLMGMKVIICKIPSEIQTENEELKKLIKLRDSASTRKEKEIYDNMATQEIARDFINRIAEDKQFLQKISAEVIPYSIKHKNKTNGYDAYHVKVRSIENPQYTLEIQAKSEYVENLARGNGAASHEKRPGKKRVLPNTLYEKEFMKQLKYTVPEYTLFIKNEDGYKAKKCSMLENTLAYFENSLYPGIELYEKIIRIIKRNSEEEERI